MKFSRKNAFGTVATSSYSPERPDLSALRNSTGESRCSTISPRITRSNFSSAKQAGMFLVTSQQYTCLKPRDPTCATAGPSMSIPQHSDAVSQRRPCNQVLSFIFASIKSRWSQHPTWRTFFPAASDNNLPSLVFSHAAVASVEVDTNASSTTRSLKGRLCSLYIIRPPKSDSITYLISSYFSTKRRLA